MTLLFRALLAVPLAAVAIPVGAQTSAAAGEGDAPVGRIVVFGDSLADGGFFLATNPLVPRNAGRFTTNPDPVAPEVLGERLGIVLRSAYGAGGSNYAIGGARVTAPNGVPSVTAQIDGYLAAGGTFGPRDLVYLQGGGNDYFAFQAAGSTNNATLTTAATELAAQVKRVQAAGATRIVTLAVQTGGAPGLQLFNRTYATALAAQGVNALYFDTDRLFNEIVADAARFGITNVTGTACRGSSLTCTPATYVTPDANTTYLLADAVHPSGITQRIQGQALASLVQAPEQIAGLAYAGQAQFRAHRGLFEGAERSVAHDGRRIALFGNLGYHYYGSDTSAQRVGINERGYAGVLGVDLALGDRSGVGLVGGYARVDGDFTGAGDYRAATWTASGYARAGIGPFRLLVDGTYGEIDYTRIRRTVVLGPTVRESRGETQGDYVAGRATAAVDVVTAGGLGLGPDLSVGYDRITIDGYAETTTTSTSAAFGRQRVESLTGRAGLVARALPEAAIGFFARGSYEHEFEDDPRVIALTPVGAPIGYVGGVARAKRDYLSYAIGADGRIAGPLRARGGVTGQALRGGQDAVTAFGGLSLAF